MSASAILSVIAPQFDSTPNRTAYIGYATEQVTPCFFVGDSRLDRAIAYMAAHLLTLDTNASVSGLSSGPVTSKREGDLAVSFANMTNIKNVDPLLAETSFGRQFLALRNSSGIFIGVTGGNDNGCSSQSFPDSD